MQLPPPKETICMKCKSQFSGKIEKDILNLSSVELAQSGKDWGQFLNLLCDSYKSVYITVFTCCIAFVKHLG